MKKVILTVAAIFAFGFANAQEEKATTGNGFAKGDMFVSGAVGIQSTNNKNTDVKTTSFEIEPKVGYFVTENIAIGGKIGYVSYKEKFGSVDTEDISGLSVGAFGRYYMTPASQFTLFGQLGFDYMTVEDKSMVGDNKINSFELAVKPGISYFVSSNFAIEATFGKLGYTSEKANATGAKENTDFTLALDLRSIGFGLTYKF